MAERERFRPKVKPKNFRRDIRKMPRRFVSVYDVATATLVVTASVPVPVIVPVIVPLPVPVPVIVLIFFWGKTWNSPGNCLLLPPLTQVPVPVF